MKLDEFTRAYIECALWSSMDESDENTGGEPLDANYGIDDIAPECLAEMQADCQDFQQSFGELFEGREGRAGHDFWLTRNHHGAGFWDGDWRDAVPSGAEWCDRYKDVGEYLTAASHPYGEVNLYVGDDGKIYC